MYPNPFTNSIQIENNSEERHISVEVYSSVGKLIFQELINEETSQISFPGASGIYNVIVKGLNGKVILEQKIIKE